MRPPELRDDLPMRVARRLGERPLQQCHRGVRRTTVKRASGCCAKTLDRPRITRRVSPQKVNHRLVCTSGVGIQQHSRPAVSAGPPRR